MDKKKINFESTIMFEGHFGTEERFGLRRWLENFTLTMNDLDAKSLGVWFTENFEAFGFLDTAQTKEEFIKYLLNGREQETLQWLKFSGLVVRKKNGVYLVNGSLEGLTKKMLIFEGEIEMRIMYEDEKYQFRFFTFSPRMRIRF